MGQQELSPFASRPADRSGPNKRTSEFVSERLRELGSERLSQRGRHAAQVNAANRPDIADETREEYRRDDQYYEEGRVHAASMYATGICDTPQARHSKI